MNRYLVIAILAAGSGPFMAGCPSPPGAEDEHGHAHEEDGSHADEEERVAQMTFWGDRYEIFMEHRYLVAEKRVNFVTHITDRETAEPRRAGPVGFVLSDGQGEPIEQTVSEPARDGIYIPTLSFPRPGEWTVALLIPSEGKEHVVELPLFTVHRTQNDADLAAAGADSHDDGIALLKEQQWKIGLKTLPAEQRNVVERLHLVGEVTAPPNRRAHVAPLIAGILQAPGREGLPGIGDVVREGEILARIQPPLVGADVLSYAGNRMSIKTLEVELRVKKSEAEAAGLKAEVALEQASLTLARTRTLHERDAKSDRELEEASGAHRAAETDLKASRLLAESYEEALAELGGESLTPGSGGQVPCR